MSEVRGLTIIEPVAPAVLTVSTGTGGANMLSSPPKEVWLAAGTGTTSIDLDFGTAVELDGFYLGFTNAAAAATWTISSMTGPNGAGLAAISGGAKPFRVPGGGPRYHGYARLSQPVTSRYFRLSVTQPAGSDPLFIGRLIAGLAFERPYEFKSGRRPVDLSKRTELQDGGFGIDAGAIKSSYRLTLADLSDDDVETLWAIIMRLGEQAPVLLIEGHDDPVKFDQMHYGLFDKFEPYERENPQDTRWGLGITDWS